jgi:hypothetical protein
MAGTPENAIAALLRQVPEVMASGVRLHQNALSQATTYPAIRYQRISTDRGSFRDLSGRSGYAQVRIQVDVFALKPAEASNLADAIRDLIEGYSGIAGGAQIDEAWIEDEDGGQDPDLAAGGGAVARQRVDVMFLGPF